MKYAYERCLSVTEKVRLFGNIGCFRNANFWNFPNSSIVPSGLQSQLVCVPELGGVDWGGGEKGVGDVGGV